MIFEDPPPNVSETGGGKDLARNRLSQLREALQRILGIREFSALYEEACKGPAFPGNFSESQRGKQDILLLVRQLVLFERVFTSH